MARDRGYQRFVTEQPAYSMLVRRIEDDILPTCQRHGMGVLSYSPLTGGWLSGRWRKDTGQQASSRASRLPERFDLSLPANQRKLDAVEALAQLADDTGISLIQLAIAFVLNHPGITSAIIGPRTMDQLEGQLAAAGIVLEPDVLDRIDEIVAPGTPSTPSTTLLTTPRSPQRHVGADLRIATLSQRILEGRSTCGENLQSGLPCGGTSRPRGTTGGGRLAPP